MDRGRLHGNVELLVDPERIVPSLQQLAERRFASSPHILVYRLEYLDRARKWARLDHANKRPPDAHPRLEERRVRGDALRTLQSSQGIHCLKCIKRERNHLALY